MAHNINVNIWDDFKSIVSEKQLFIQYVDLKTHYYVFAVDGPIFYSCNIEISDPKNDDQIDFEDNYMASANRPQCVAQSATKSHFVGKNLYIPSGEISGYVEWEHDDKVYLNKMLPIPSGAAWGDKVDLTIHLKANDAQVGGYGDGIYLMGDKPDKWFQGNGAGEIPDYCKVRCTYTKGNIDSDTYFIIIAEFLE